MKLPLYILLPAATGMAIALPLPPLQDPQAIDSSLFQPTVEIVSDLRSSTADPSKRKSRQKRQSDWSWYTGWNNNYPNIGGTVSQPEEAHWTNPSRNPFDICDTPEGKQLGAQCSGGPPDKPGWNPFTTTGNTGSRNGGNSRITGGGRTSNSAGGSNTVPGIDSGSRGGGSGGSRTAGGKDSGRGSTKAASGCLDVLGVASLGADC
ncbi:hypothetical protein Slin14017_G126970 [Septoria linicola]|nr:hypothetical protein Slin14017_G126970 [Septoria linicola]